MKTLFNVLTIVALVVGGAVMAFGYFMIKGVNFSGKHLS